MQSLSEAIYTLLVHRRFRTGPLPAPAVNERIHLKIYNACRQNAPVPIFLFWGGAKNPNLPITHADRCEQTTLDYLQQLHQEVSKLYSPGLQFFIFPGDARVHYANHIPESATTHYVETLSQMCARYGELFTLIPVSRLYTQYAEAFQSCLAEARKQLCQETVAKHPLFNILVDNARKNIFTGDLSTEREKAERSQDAALRYIRYRLAEEKAMLYQDFEPCIRASFIKLSLFFSFYAPYLELAMTTPRLDASLHFYAGKKGNITQPWQAVAYPKEQKVFFLSQSQLLIPPHESARV
jgi:hypothetical protein